MRTLPIRVALAFTLGAGFAPCAPMERLERQRLVAHLEMTGSWLPDEVSGLSLAQCRFRLAPGTWNITEVVEHLALSGSIYWRDFHKAMTTPPRSAGRADKDAEVLWYGIDRTGRQTALAAESPKEPVRDVGARLDALRSLHTEILKYVRTTDDDLRSHIVERERCDAYQWLLLISTHEQRHILQIREIKAHPKFPKK